MASDGDLRRYSFFVGSLLTPQKNTPIPLPIRNKNMPNPTGVPHMADDQRPSILSCSLLLKLPTDETEFPTLAHPKLDPPALSRAVRCSTRIAASPTP